MWLVEAESEKRASAVSRNVSFLCRIVSSAQAVFESDPDLIHVDDGVLWTLLHRCGKAENLCAVMLMSRGSIRTSAIIVRQTFCRTAGRGWVPLGMERSIHTCCNDQNENEPTRIRKSLSISSCSDGTRNHRSLTLVYLSDVLPSFTPVRIRRGVGPYVSEPHVNHKRIQRDHGGIPANDLLSLAPSTSSCL